MSVFADLFSSLSEYVEFPDLIKTADQLWNAKVPIYSSVLRLINYELEFYRFLYE